MEDNGKLKEIVLKTFAEIAEKMRYSEIAKEMGYDGRMLNERYLHHFFSHSLLGSHSPIQLSLLEEGGGINLHPEWPTFKKQVELRYGRYRNENGKYFPRDEGTAGFIDFAIGEYKKPSIGIEMVLKFGWSHEEVVYDFLKLLDSRNPFDASFSFNVILREKGLPRKGRVSRIKNKMESAFAEAKRRLEEGPGICVSRGIHFFVIEVDKDDERRFWVLDKNNGKFEIGESLK